MTLREEKYSTVHMWLITKYGKATECQNDRCVFKHPKRFEWALIKGKKYAKIRDNFIQLCPSCHRKYDYTEEQRHKTSLIKTGNHYRARQIYQLKSGKILRKFNSIMNASIRLGINRTSILNVLAGRSTSAGGFNWRYIN